MNNANNTASSGSGNLSGFGYGLVVSMGILVIAISIILVCFHCIRKRLSTVNNDGNSNNVVEYVQRSGLDEATILSYPKLLYCEARLQKSEVTPTATCCCCSICLGDYKDSDMVRVLPDCAHLFHVSCIDPWLRIHPTCPLCRTSPIPTPLTQLPPLPTSTPIWIS
ncbi:RING-H2 finger protein ATL70 [Senna tora]|uniref:RING-H2 finger protein ATL70 n=1 Tax=Senna tora TaxID=362788 RepID=A0A834WFD2_9FABA|nr:RING-H2 finger protein ATL70 [Senna tora]